MSTNSSPEWVGLDVDDLAQLIRMADPAHEAGAGEIAEKILPWINARFAQYIERVRLEEHKRTCSGSNQCLRCLALGDERAVETFKRGIAELEQP